MMTTVWIPADPSLSPAPGFDGADWRLRHFRTVGSVLRFHRANVLALCVAERGAEHDALVAELAACPGNVNAVLTACDDVKARHEAQMEQAAHYGALLRLIEA